MPSNIPDATRTIAPLQAPASGGAVEVARLLQRARQQLAAGQAESAERDLLQAVQIDPEHARVHYWLGSARMLQGHGSAAIGPFERAVQLMAGSAEAWNGLGAALLAAGRRGEAERAFMNAGRLDPNSPASWLNLAEQYLQERRFTEARAVGARAGRLAPTDPRPARLLAEIARAEACGRGRGAGQPRISAIVHTRDEERNVEDCLRCLLWADEVIVADTASTDRTVEIAGRYADKVVPIPAIPWIDRGRDLSAAHASCEWIFFVDADERVPAKLVPVLYQTIREYGEIAAGFCLPYKNHFLGRWIHHSHSDWWPGYKTPMLLRRGRFQARPGVHGGVATNGPVLLIPHDDPAIAIDHYSYPDLSSYLRKLTDYTAGEAQKLDTAGERFDWRLATAALAREFSAQYDSQAGGGQDGVEGLLLSFFSGLYRFLAQARLYEAHARDGRLTPEEQAVPRTARELFEELLRHLPEPPGLVTGPANRGAA